MNNLKNIFRYIGRTSKFIDYPLLISYVILCFIGLVMVYSASMVAATKGTLTGGVEVSGTYFYNRQLIYVIMSFIIVFFISFMMNIKVFKQSKVQQWIMIIIFVLLFLTLLVGKNINGSKSWLDLGFMNLQASELLKIALILYISYVLSKKLPQLRGNLRIIKGPIILIILCLGLVLLQGDIGQTLLTLIIILAMFLFVGIGAKKIVKGPILYIILGFGNGGLFGRGLGNGIMKLGYLPEAHTDFIFAVICEELGLIGALLVIGLLFFIVFRAFILATKTSSYFYKLICVGVASYIGSQTFVNLGGISATIPLTGVTLPFISFGGSSMISLSIAMGLLLLVARQIKVEEKRAIKNKKTKVDIPRQY